MDQNPKKSPKSPLALAARDGQTVRQNTAHYARRRPAAHPGFVKREMKRDNSRTVNLGEQKSKPEPYKWINYQNPCVKNGKKQFESLGGERGGERAINDGKTDEKRSAAGGQWAVG
ncbi:hypothetical protein niasHT_025414 [Heterodera trifolii]|uniref:Uncharacterized protein n=1 Tax=Heterodera trifolii TaxID=157864 RepID=A0ABD2KES6_9BILA